MIAAAAVTELGLTREIAQLERIAALVKRRSELVHELEGSGVVWSTLPLKAVEIVSVVAAKYGLEVADLTGESKQAAVVEPRQEAMALLREQMLPDGRHRFSTSQIGDALGGRDHTTVIHGIARHKARVA